MWPLSTSDWLLLSSDLRGLLRMGSDPGVTVMTLVAADVVATDSAVVGAGFLRSITGLSVTSDAEVNTVERGLGSGRC